MFEVGKHYQITTANDGDFITKTVKVLEWSFPLLKYDYDGKATVLNTSSPVFFEAGAGYSPEEVDEAERRFMASMPGKNVE